jgi:ABC-type molybdenum transport system ATPase subunit/photorepair protein PhrA
MFKGQNTVIRGVSKREKFDGVGDNGSGDTTMVKVDTHLKAFLENFQT